MNKRYNKVYYIIQDNFNFIISKQTKHALCNVKEQDLKLSDVINERVEVPLTDKIGLRFRKWDEYDRKIIYLCEIEYKDRAWFNRDIILNAHFGFFLGTISEILVKIKNSIHNTPRKVKGSLNIIHELDLKYDKQEYNRLIWEK